MDIICKRLFEPTPAERDQIRHIYEASFPPSERKPFDQVVGGLTKGNYICLMARPDKAEKVVALALLLLLPRTSMAFLEYMAVESAAQGKGVGSQLLGEVVTYFGRENLADGVVWEVEPPTQNPADDQNRRIRFYERLGAKLIDLSTTYAMPNFEHQKGRVPLRLMQLPLEEQPDKARVGAIVRDIYKAAYPGWEELRDEILEALARVLR